MRYVIPLMALVCIGLDAYFAPGRVWSFMAGIVFGALIIDVWRCR